MRSPRYVLEVLQIRIEIRIKRHRDSGTLLPCRRRLRVPYHRRGSLITYITYGWDIGSHDQREPGTVGGSRVGGATPRTPPQGAGDRPTPPAAVGPVALRRARPRRQVLRSAGTLPVCRQDGRPEHRRPRGYHRQAARQRALQPPPPRLCWLGRRGFL